MLCWGIDDDLERLTCQVVAYSEMYVAEAIICQWQAIE